MSDQGNIEKLVAIGSNADLLVAAQHVAAKRLLDYDGEEYPHDGCAITLSVLLQDAGIKTADVFTAIELTQTLKDRGWTKIELGQQAAGDVGTTCGKTPVHGQDHIYLVLKPVNSDEMVIADNQEPKPHFRFASGLGGKTPTKYFLRASGK